MQWAHDSSGWIAEGGEAYLQNEREGRENLRGVNIGLFH